MTKLAIVILNYNGEEFLAKFLPSVIDHSEFTEIIVADNNSSDGSIALMKSQFPELNVIELKKNHGFAGGYNEALQHVNAEYFLLLNSDVEVTPNWLSPLLDFMDKNPTYAACQPKIKDYNQKEKFEYAGASGGFIDSMGYPYCRGRILNEVETDQGQYDSPIDILWSSGACMVIRSKVFFGLGGFDSDFFAHMEEIDLCWRVRSAGHKIKCLPESVVFHVGGGTLNKSSAFKTYLNFRNGLYLLTKNLPMPSLIVKLPIRIILDWIAAAKFVLDLAPKHAFAVFRAHLAFLVNSVKMLRKRSKTSADTALGSVLFNYYIRGKKKFSDL